MIYSTVNYGLGATSETASPAQASARIERMTASLRNWLALRAGTDSRAFTVAQVQRLAKSRFQDEQKLAETLHALFTQAGYPIESLPIPDVTLDPNAAVELAELALSGETPGPAAQGMLPFLLIGLGVGALWLISSMVKSYADLAAEKERIRCIESGACTDSGFWMKVGGVALAAYVVREFFFKKKAA